MGKWVFGYGSLMWKIDFPTIRKITGYVEGFVRTMEWADEVHRGVPKQKSRTAAIFESKKNEKVWGVVYEISEDYWNRVLQPNVSYRERGGYGVKEVTFYPFDASVDQATLPDTITVTLFLGDKSSEYYMPGSIEELARHIVKAVGASGTNLEYLYSTAESLRMILPPGVTDEYMFKLEATTRRLEHLIKPKGETHYKEIAMDIKNEKRRPLLRKLFSAVDEDFNRMIVPEEFQDLSGNVLGLKLSKDDIKGICDQVDTNKDGAISVNEFINYFLDLMHNNEKTFKQKLILGKDRPKEGVNGVAYALLTYEWFYDAGVISDRMVRNLPAVIEENKALLEQMRLGINSEAMEVIEFFFKDDIREAMDLWFKKSEEIDEMIKEKYTGLVEKALNGELDDWVKTPSSCLALILLLNQFPRNIYRGTPKMYSGDEKAQGIAMQALFYGYWKSLTPLQIAFLPCMVLATAENLHYQELGEQIWENYIQVRLETNHPLKNIQFIFRRNKEQIKKFGRFPHRNEVLGRESTPEELELLKESDQRPDLPMGFGNDGKFHKNATSDQDGFTQDKLASLAM